MVSFMHSVSVSIQSFAAGIWQSHPLQHHTPDLNFYIKEHENFEEKTPIKGEELVQNCSTIPTGHVAE